MNQSFQDEENEETSKEMWVTLSFSWLVLSFLFFSFDSVLIFLFPLEPATNFVSCCFFGLVFVVFSLPLLIPSFAPSRSATTPNKTHRFLSSFLCLHFFAFCSSFFLPVCNSLHLSLTSSSSCFSSFHSSSFIIVLCSCLISSLRLSFRCVHLLLFLFSLLSIASIAAASASAALHFSSSHFDPGLACSAPSRLVISSSLFSVIFRFLLSV